MPATVEFAAILGSCLWLVHTIRPDGHNHAMAMPLPLATPYGQGATPMATPYSQGATGELKFTDFYEKLGIVGVGWIAYFKEPLTLTLTLTLSPILLQGAPSLALPLTGTETVTLTLSLPLPLTLTLALTLTLTLTPTPLQGGPGPPG